MPGQSLGAVPWIQHAREVAAAQEREEANRIARRDLQNDLALEQSRADAQLLAIQAEIDQLRALWDQQLNKDVEVTVTGPEDIQAGATNSYTIETYRLQKAMPGVRNQQRGQHTPAKVDVQVINGKTNKVVYGPKNLESKGKVDLQLPSDLDIPPDAELVLQVSAQSQEGTKVKVTEKLKLTGPLYLTHVATDRPMYRPGDVVRARSLTLQRSTLKPPIQDLELRFRLTDGQGKELFNRLGNARLKLNDQTKDLLKGPDGKILNGYGMDDFPLAADLPEGVYTLIVSEERNRFPAETRKFLVRRFQTPRLNKEVEFHRASYGPGDPVQANCVVSRVEGGKPLAGEPVQASVNVDGVDVPVDNATQLKTDAAGRVTVTFKLPAKLELGRGSLSVVCHDGKITETLDRPLPIVLNKLLVEFFPEGGDLVAGVVNRVYFQVRTTLGKPADLSGKIVDDTGAVVASAKTLNDNKEPGVNQGLGAFTFTPKIGRRYQLKIDTPLNITGDHPLPATRTDGVVLNIPQGVISDRIAVKVHNAGQKRNLFVGAYCRGRLVDQQSLDNCGVGSDHTVALRPPTGISGVYRVTVFEKLPNRELKPLAERLIYRPALEKLAFNIRTDRKSYAPGENVIVRVAATTTNSNSRPPPVVMCASVVDHSMLKLADEKTYRSLPTHFYLTTEVGRSEELEHADFLLTDHPKAPVTLDLLLGTQGWRRFAEQHQEQPEAKKAPNNEVWTKHKADADRVLFAYADSARQEKLVDDPGLRKLVNEIVDKGAVLKQERETIETTRLTKRQQANAEAQRLEVEYQRSR